MDAHAAFSVGKYPEQKMFPPSDTRQKDARNDACLQAGYVSRTHTSDERDAVSAKKHEKLFCGQTPAARPEREANRNVP